MISLYQMLLIFQHGFRFKFGLIPFCPPAKFSKRREVCLSLKYGMTICLFGNPIICLLEKIENSRKIREKCPHLIKMVLSCCNILYLTRKIFFS